MRLQSMPSPVSRLRSLLLAAFMLATLPFWVGCASTDGGSTGPQTTDGNAWVRRVTRAYDPEGRFAAAKLLRFDYVIRDENYNEVSRAKHLWDRESGDYRYEADASQFAASTFFDDASQTWKKANLKLPAGALVAIVDMKTRQGKVYINGKAQPETLLNYVLDRIDNDGKWLLLPFSLAPPTKVTYVNDEIKNGKMLVNLAVVTPDAAGSSKHDLWIVTVDAHGRIDHTGIKSPGSFLALVGVWDMDQAVDRVSFSTHRFLGERTIVYESLALPASVDASAFTSVSPVLVSQAPSPVPPLKKEH
jgi:hypothetical protein